MTVRPRSRRRRTIETPVWVISGLCRAQYGSLIWYTSVRSGKQQVAFITWLVERCERASPHTVTMAEWL